jgi:hypothetical protein
MQALTARPAAAFCSPATAAAQRPRRQQQRGGGVVVRADLGSCRDKISERRDMSGEIEGTSTVIFLGADGNEVPVECPKVGCGWRRLRERAQQWRSRHSCPACFPPPSHLFISHPQHVFT